MIDIYLVIIILLLVLAVSSLIVGVSNDATNFLNSAIGSKAAPMKVILSIAGLGVIVGATFSSGMMEIARSGVFYPGQFSFSDIMLIFMTVMITNVLLLDAFNTLGLPTSTSVAIVFALLGAALGISLIRINNSTDSLSNLNAYINSSKALAIIAGILLSVVIAFFFGMVVQFITRFIFSFNYRRYMKWFGGIWGGFAITAIIFFMLVKGAKGASFMTTERIAWLSTHTWQLLLYSFIAITIILQLLISLFRINIFRIIVLVGTFSLAMAFAGNDLVNFIGVPLAGLESFREYSRVGIEADSMMMSSLSNPVSTPTFFLLAAGLIMVVTLFLSKKSRHVTQTEISLASQGESDEKYSSTRFSRAAVRFAGEISKFFDKITPDKFQVIVERRFDKRLVPADEDEQLSFDLLRASVNMFVASILIALGTSLKLPLSTTYVTFMVAMGSSLADRAWGRESAVNRIAGVFTVIGGWFTTAFIAMTAALLIVVLLNWGGIIAMVAVMAITLFVLIKTNFINKVSEDPFNNKTAEDEIISGENIVSRCNESILGVIDTVPRLFSMTLVALVKEDRKKMKKVVAEVDDLNSFAKELKYNIYPTLKKLEEEYVETGHNYVQVLDYIREIAHCLRYIAEPVFDHIDNHHPPLLKEQIKDIDNLNDSVLNFYNSVVIIDKELHFENIDKLIAKQQTILDLINKIKKKQVKYIKAELVGTKITMLYLNLLSETKNLLLHTINMVKAHRDFIISDKNKKIIKSQVKVILN
jgi:phosphate/sulfate permease